MQIVEISLSVDIMKKIPENIDAIFSRRMKNAGLVISLQNEFRKWLRFYLDFCSKYYLDPANHETPAQFMQKLNEKGQSPEKQKQAAQSVKVYLDIIASETIKTEKSKVKDTDSIAHSDAHIENTRWTAIFNSLNEAIRIRNYSKKTFRTYAGWINRFGWFVNFKNTEEIVIDDVKQFLTDLAVNRNVAATTQN